MDKSNKFGNRSIKAYQIIRAVALLVLVLIVAFVAMSASATNASADSITTDSSGSSFIVIEKDSGRILIGNNISTRMEPASTTKILTAICVIENCNIDNYIVIPKVAENTEGSSIYLKCGEKWKIKDLLYGLMLRSGNDAAVALSSIFGGEKEFAELMNLTAIKCGAYYSHFVNPHGLPDNQHYTTAYDLAMITAYAYKNDEFKNIVATEHYYYDYNSERRCFVNKNKLLNQFKGANGVKTGYTKRAGRCLVFGAERNGMQLISVVLNEPNMWQKSANLLEEYFTRYAIRQVLSKEDFKAVTVNGKTVFVHTLNDLCYPMTDDELDKIDISYTIRSNQKMLRSNTEIGTVNIKIANRLIFSEKVYTI